MIPSDSELTAYLDEVLPVARAVEVERLLREQPELRQRAASLARSRDQGGHTVGEIWRRHRVSCPTREQLGSFLLNVAPQALEEYINFHLSVIGCRFCQANLDDLTVAQRAGEKDRQLRRQRYFESSAGLLRSKRES